MIFLSLLILYNITKVKKDEKGDRIISFKPITIFMVPFLTIFKELLEVIIFLLPFVSNNKMSLIGGSLLGVGLTYILSLIIYKSTLKINISKMFLVITFILILLGGDMIGEGLELIVGNISDSVKGLSTFLYTVPLLFILTKKEINRYLRK